MRVLDVATEHGEIPSAMGPLGAKVSELDFELSKVR